MTSDYSPLAKDVQKDFQRWFEDTVPPDTSFFPANEPYIISEAPFLPPDASFPASKASLLVIDIPSSGETDHLNHRTPSKRVNNRPKLSEVLKFGSQGAVVVGIFVVFILTYLSILGWYSSHWPNPIIFIILAMVIGFMGGLYKGLYYKLRERTYHKYK